MSKLAPTILFDDFYGSAGNVTAYHMDGRCHLRKRSCPPFPASEAQKACLEVHRRAMAAWRTVPHEIQNIWNGYAESVEPHRPPFDHSSHISGNNLFVSAYHGFATLGNEHIPEPASFEPFPPFAVSIMDAAVTGNEITIRFALTIEDPEERYRLLTKIQLAKQGGGRNPGAMRNYLADTSAKDKIAVVKIPDFTSVSGFDSDSSQLHTRCILLDTKTGYRSQFISASGLVSL